MSLKLKLVQNQIKSHKQYGKLYARRISSGILTSDELIRRMVKGRSLTRPDVIAVMNAFTEELQQALGDGMTVETGDLGSFMLTVESVPVEDPKKFRPSTNIKRVKAVWHPVKTYREDSSGKMVELLASKVKVKVERG